MIPPEMKYMYELLWIRFHQIPSFFWDQILEVSRSISAVTSLALAVRAQTPDHLWGLKYVAILLGSTIHPETTPRTIMAEERIPRGWRKNLRLLRKLLFERDQKVGESSSRYMHYTKILSKERIGILQKRENRHTRKFLKILDRDKYLGKW